MFVNWGQCEASLSHLQYFYLTWVILIIHAETLCRLEHLPRVVNTNVVYVYCKCICSIYARLSIAAGGLVTLVSSCEGERGEPELHRWCQGRAPPVPRPSCLLRSQTGSKRSKGRTESLHMTETAMTYRHIHNFRLTVILLKQSWLRVHPVFFFFFLQIESSWRSSPKEAINSNILSQKKIKHSCYRQKYNITCIIWLYNI